MRRVVPILGSAVLVAALLPFASPAASAAPVPAPVPAPAVIPGGSYHATTPRRIVNTESGFGAPRGLTRQLVLTAARAGVPGQHVCAVALHITTVSPAGAGHLTVYRAGYPRPATWNLSFSRGETTTGMAIANTDATGRFVIYSSQPTQLIVDVDGYFTDASQAAGGALYDAVAPARLLDTRASRSPVGPQRVRALRVLGTDGVPTSGVLAVVANVTAISPSAAGYLTAYPAGAALPGITTVSFARGQTVADRAIVPVGRSGSIDLYNRAGSVNLAIDITGYFTTSGRGSYYVAVEPTRIYNGRTSGGWTTEAIVPMTGIGQTPQASGIIRPTATVDTYSVVTASGSGYIATAPSHVPVRPTTSDINFSGSDPSNLSIEQVGVAGGTGYGVVGATLSSIATVTIDQVGYFAAGLPQPPLGTWAWGDNSAQSGYLLGEYLTGSRMVTTPVSGPPGSVVWLTAAAESGMDLLADGRLQTWTIDETPGEPDATSDEITPTTELTGAQAVSASNEIALALRTDGTVWERMSAGNWAPRPGVTGAIAVASENTGYGDHVGYVLLADHTVLRLTEACGGGMGCAPAALQAPTPVTGLTDVDSLATGFNAMYAVRSDGTVWAWGDDSQHQLGDGGTTASATPVQVPGLSGIVQVAGGGFNDTYALDSTGAVWRWGADAPTPVRFSVPSGVVAIAPDQQGGDVVARRADGTVWAWQRASNTFGPVPYLTGETGASCGQYLCFAWH